MNPASSHARDYRRLGYLTLAHAAILVALTAWLLVGKGFDKPWIVRTWVGAVTLWFLWIPVLTLHRGRSIWRFAVFVLISLILTWPTFRFYNVYAPEAFGLPPFITMNPVSAWRYSSAYLAGRTQARKDVAAGILAIADAGLVPGHERWDARILRERYQIEIRPLGDWPVDERSLGHQTGYNSVSMPEIDRRFGWDGIQAAREEALQEDYTRAEQSVKELTKRLSSIPPDAKVTTHLIRPLLNNHPLKDPVVEQRLAPFVHAIEQSVTEAVPEDAPSFEFRISAKLAPQSPPSFEMSGSANAPQAVWQVISDRLHAIPSPEWNEGSLSVALEFLIRP